MKFFLSLLLSPLYYLVFSLLLLVFHPIQVIALNVLGYRAHKNSVDVLNWALVQCMKIMGTRISYKGFNQLPLDKPKIFICNHQSMWDISPLIWKLRAYHLKFISKIELAKGVPSISYNLKHGGSVCIDRNNPAESKLLIGKFAEYIKLNNYSVCIFAEGSRSRDGKLKPFKHGGVKAMLEVMPEACIVPIAIKNTAQFDNYGKLLKNIGIHVEFTMLQAREIDIQVLPKEMEQIRHEIGLCIDQ